jgi:hypothetical protein
VEAPTAGTAAYDWPPVSPVDPAIEQDAAAIVDAALGPVPESSSTVDLSTGTLSDVHRAMLDFERRWWRQPGAKEQAIRDSFAMSPTRYYQTLNALLDLPAAVSHDAGLVHRLQRLRASAVRGRRLG